MKKRGLFLLVATLFIATIGFGQTSARRWMVGGFTNLSLGSDWSFTKNDGQKSNESNGFSYEFSPTVGYFVIDNLAVRLTHSFLYGHYSYDDYDSDYASSVFGPGVIYYFGEKKLKPFALTDIQFGSYNSSYSSSDFSDEYRGSSFGWDLGGGVAWFVNNHVAFSLALKYTRTTDVDKDDKSSKDITGELAVKGGVTVVF